MDFVDIFTAAFANNGAVLYDALDLSLDWEELFITEGLVLVLIVFGVTLDALENTLSLVST